MSALKKFAMGFAGAGLLAVSGMAQAFFADALDSSSGTGVFGSGIVTGAPDGGGLFFPSPDSPGGFITVEFFTAIGDGPGADIAIIDFGDTSADPSEPADIFVSTDGLGFTFIGSIIGGPSPEGLIDIAGAFSDPVHFVKIENSLVGAPDGDGLDVDAVEGLNEFISAVPEPATLLLVGIGLAGFGFTRRRS